MFRLFRHTQIDFLAVRRTALTVSAAVAVPGLLLLLFRGLNESIDFTGGTLVQVSAHSSEMQTATIRAALESAGIRGAEIQTFGARDEFVIRARLDLSRGVPDETTQETAAAVDTALATAFGRDGFVIQRTEAVGPKVGAELRRLAALAILIGFGGVLLYLSVRIEWRFGVAAVSASAHDILLTLAFISLLNLEVSPVVVVALLLIVGYSLNDTIITFDRVRENLKKYRRKNLYEILNLSVNQTLPRTVLTSLTTLGAILSLLIFGGEVIRSFAWVAAFGIVIGTYSSIYIASPVLLIIERKWPGEDTHGARAVPTKQATPTSTAKRVAS